VRVGAASPEQAYERRWALTLVEQALARLRAEYEHSGKGTEFGHLKVCLKAERGTIPYAQIAGDLGVSESYARVLAIASQRFRNYSTKRLATRSPIRPISPRKCTI